MSDRYTLLPWKLNEQFREANLITRVMKQPPKTLDNCGWNYGDWLLVNRHYHF